MHCKTLFGGLLFLTCTHVFAATHYTNGQWYQDGHFVKQDWYEVDGVLSADRPGQITQVIDLKEGYVLPPLAEAHNHNLQNPFLAQRFSEAYLQSGILYGLMMCGNHNSAADTRQMLAAKGLQIEVAGACISSSDGHPLRMARQPAPGQQPPKPQDVYDNSYIVVDKPEHIETKWPLIEKGTRDIVKLIMVHSEKPDRRGNQKYFGINGLKPDLVTLLTERLHSQGFRVAVHVDSAADFATAVQADADIIAHLPGYRWEQGYAADDYRIDPQVIEQAARQQTTVITTASVTDMIYAKKPGQAEKVRQLQTENLSRLHQAGVPLIIGSDRFDANVVDEILYLAETGVFSERQLLDMLVTDTPRALFPGRKIGQFKSGYEASFVLLEQDPLTGLQALKQPVMLVGQGQMLITKMGTAQE